MNFTRGNYLFNDNFTGKKNKTDEVENMQNELNQKILDSIIDDNEDEFTEAITQSGDMNKINKVFEMTNYKFPRIMKSKPTYASLCAFFGARNCLNALSMLVPSGFDSDEIKKTDDFGRSLIHFACAGGSIDIIRELDQSNYSLNDVDSEGCKPSHYAAMAGNLDIFKYLWMKGADLVSSSNQYNKMTPLHVASLYGNLNIVKFICENVVDENSSKKNNDQNDDQNKLNPRFFNFYGFHKNYCKFSTPLHLACEGGHEDVLRYLLTKKELIEIQLNSLDRSSRTPLLVACKNGSIGCLKALVEYDQNLLKQKKNRKHNALIDAAAGGYLDIVTFLLKQKEIKIDHTNSQKLDALTVAVKNQHFDVMKALIQKGAMKKYNDEKIGELFLSALGTNDLKMAKYIDSVCKVPYFSKSNHRVVKWCRVSSLKMDENTKWGTQFLQQACLLENEEMIDFILDKKVDFQGVDLSLLTSKKWTPFMDFLITKGVDLSNSLSSEGAPLIVSTIKGGNLANIKKMISKGSLLNAEIIQKHNCVLEACRLGKTDLFDFLMSFDPIISNGEDCVSCCLYCYMKRELPKKLYMAEKLLEKGFVDVNKRFCTYDNDTLLSRAVNSHNFEFLSLFEKYGADYSNIPLRFEQLGTNREKEIIDYLVDHGCKFNKSFHFKDNYRNRISNQMPLMQSFYLMNCADYNKEFPEFLIDYLNDEEIVEIKKGNEKVVDNFMKLNSFNGVLKIIKKCNCVIYPKDVSKDEFIEWIMSSGNEELIDLVVNGNK